PTGANAAPPTSVSPLIATEPPNESPERPRALILDVSVVLRHPVPGLRNTYAEPWDPSSPGAPATTESPLIATELPRPSRSLPSEAVSSAVSVAAAHPPPGLTNTYAAPCPRWPPRAPPMTVSPSMATDAPSRSTALPSDAVSLAVCVMVAQP